MKSSRTRRKTRQESAETRTITVQLPLPMIGGLHEVWDRFFALCVMTGEQALQVLMEEERTKLCGPKRVPDAQRKAVRFGTTPSQVTLSGRRVPIRRPRVRAVTGGEVPLRTFEYFTSRDPLNAHTLEAILAGVSTRNYRASLATLPPGRTERAVSKSAVSRRFAALTKQLLARWLGRPLERLDLRVIMIDGIAFRGRCVLIALGIAADGTKHVLGLREGTTENAAVGKALIADLIERGVSPEQAMVFVIDGSKGLRKAIRDTFGERGVIQRCQVHKRRNVTEHLPEELRPLVKARMQEAYDLADAALAKRKLEQLASWLEREHPGAAASLREGLDETLTLQGLGVTGDLYRTLRSTNPIENLNSAVAHHTRNVRRWRNGTMVLRWVAAAVKRAEQRFNRIRGHTAMPALIAALKQHEKKLPMDSKRQVA